MKRAKTSVLSLREGGGQILVTLPEPLHGELVYEFYVLPGREPELSSARYRDGKPTTLGREFYRTALRAARRAWAGRKARGSGTALSEIFAEETKPDAD